MDTPNDTESAAVTPDESTPIAAPVEVPTPEAATESVEAVEAPADAPESAEVSEVVDEPQLPAVAETEEAPEAAPETEAAPEAEAVVEEAELPDLTPILMGAVDQARSAIVEFSGEGVVGDYLGASFDDPAQRAAQGGALVDFLASAVDPAGAYGQLLRRELEILARTGTDYLLHEHLEEVNTPLYFHQFVERSHAEGLQYLGDADVPTMLTRGLPSAVAETLGRISPDIIRLEQYLDFVSNRQFRNTLLCHRGVELRRALGPRQLEGGWLRCAAEPAGNVVDLSPGVRVTLRTTAGPEIESELPVTKAGLVILRRAWPDALRFEAVVERARAMLGEVGVAVPSEVDAAAGLGADLLELHCRGVLELHSMRPELCTTVTERPRASAHARHWAEGRGFVVSQWHLRADVDPVAAAIVRRLDGAHDRAALLDALTQDVLAGRLPVTESTQVEPGALHELLDDDRAGRVIAQQPVAQSQHQDRLSAR